MKIGGVLQPALARTSSAVAITRSAVALRIQPAIDRTAEISFQAANVASVLFLAPAAMIALAFGLWRLGQDLGWTGPFVISEGLFSHWIVWVILSIGLKALAVMITRDSENRRTQKEIAEEEI